MSIRFRGRSRGGSAGDPNSVKLTAEGDSITAWNGTDDYPHVGAAAIGAPYSVTVNNVATWGITTTNMLANYSTRIGSSYDSSKSINMLSITGGTNDGVNTVALQIYKNIRNMVKRAYSTGYNRAVVCTIISRAEVGYSPANNGTYDGDTLTLNTYFRDYYNNDLDCDGIADFAANSLFNTSADCANATYYTDPTHPTTAGEAVMGGSCGYCL